MVFKQLCGLKYLFVVVVESSINQKMQLYTLIPSTCKNRVNLAQIKGLK